MPYLRQREFALPIFAVVLAVATTVAYGPEKADFGDATDYTGTAVSLLNDGTVLSPGARSDARSSKATAWLCWNSV
jgi:hypothetical protein